MTMSQENPVTAIVRDWEKRIAAAETRAARAEAEAGLLAQTVRYMFDGLENATGDPGSLADVHHLCRKALDSAPLAAAAAQVLEAAEKWASTPQPTNWEEPQFQSDRELVDAVLALRRARAGEPDA